MIWTGALTFALTILGDCNEIDCVRCLQLFLIEGELAVKTKS